MQNNNLTPAQQETIKEVNSAFRVYGFAILFGAIIAILSIIF